jgi:hypothetical protein
MNTHDATCPFREDVTEGTFWSTDLSAATRPLTRLLETFSPYTPAPSDMFHS